MLMQLDTYGFYIIIIIITFPGNLYGYPEKTRFLGTFYLLRMCCGITSKIVAKGAKFLLKGCNYLKRIEYFQCYFFSPSDFFVWSLSVKWNWKFSIFIQHFSVDFYQTEIIFFSELHMYWRRLIRGIERYCERFSVVIYPLVCE